MPTELPYRVLVVEARHPASRQRATALRRQGYDVLGPLASAAEALAVFEAADPPVDAVVLAVSLAGPADGLSLAQALRAHGPLPLILLLGSAPAPPLPCLRPLQPVSLLPQCCDPTLLHLHLALALPDPAAPAPPAPVAPALLRLKGRHLLLPKNKGFEKVRLADIFYVETAFKQCRIVTSQGIYWVGCSLRDLLAALPAHRFVQIHRSYFVNVKHITQLKAGRCHLVVAGKELPLSRCRRPELLQRLLLLE